jgi:hypothetical protein
MRDMAETTKIDQRERSNKPNGVDKWNAFVLTITMGAVLFYTYLTHNILTADTRPYIGIAINAPTEYFPFSPEAKKPIQAPIGFINYGKRPADAEIRKLVEYSATRIYTGPTLEGAQVSLAATD